MNIDYANQLRQQGLSYQQIADIIGCTKQNIQKRLTSKIELNKSFEKVIFPNLIIWCEKNNIKSLTEFASLLDAEERSVRNKMQGKTEFIMSEINQILIITKMKYEKAFMK